MGSVTVVTTGKHEVTDGHIGIELKAVELLRVLDGDEELKKLEEALL
jgi:hypothetical protein